MKALKRIGLFVAIYLFMSIGAVMAIQHSWWWMIPSILLITVGMSLIEYYATHYGKFNDTKI